MFKKDFTYFNFAYFPYSYYMTPFYTNRHFLYKIRPKFPGLLSMYTWFKLTLCWFMNYLWLTYKCWLVNFCYIKLLITIFTALSFGFSSYSTNLSHKLKTYEIVVDRWAFYACEINDCMTFLLIIVESIWYYVLAIGIMWLLIIFV